MSTATAVSAPVPVAVKKTAPRAKKSAAPLPEVVATPTPTPVSENTVTVPEAVVVATPESTPAPKKSSSRKSTKASPVETVSVVVTPAPAPEAVVETVAPVETEPSSSESTEDASASQPTKRKTQITRADVEANNQKIEALFKTLLQTVKDKKINGITKMIESLKKSFTHSANQALRAVDLAKKTPRRKASTNTANPSGAPKKPSGLDKPVRISAEYGRFIKMPADSEMTRGEAIQKLYFGYIKPRADICVPGKGRNLNIDADPELKALFGNTADEKGEPKAVNFITMRQFLKHHFTPVEETVTTSA